MPYPFTIRRASASDKEAVVQLCQAIQADDWVPCAFDDLVGAAPPRGLYVAEIQGRIIGCYSLELPAPGEAYFSAMRVRPETQGRGIGSLFCRAQVEQARGLGSRKIYLLSVVDNLPAHRTVQKNGFANLGEWIIYDEIAGVPLRGVFRRSRPARPGDDRLLPGFADRMTNGEVIATAESAWTVRSVRPEDYGPENLVVVEGATGLAGFMLLAPTPDGLLIRRLEGTPEAAADLLEYARAEMARSGHTVLRISLPASAEPLLHPLGLDQAHAFRAYVFCWAH